MSPYDKANIGDIVAGMGNWFTAELLRLIAKADASNRSLLALAFPEEVAAYEDWYRGAA